MNKRVMINLTIAGVVIVSFAVIQTMVENVKIDRQKREYTQKLVLAEDQFQKEVNRAKRVTADSCATVFYELVTPLMPGGTIGSPKLIMMGEEIDYTSFSPSAYWLKPKADRVELWMHDVTPSGAGKPKKIGEKLSQDSKSCQAR